MQTKIFNLKKGDLFIFNGIEFKVKKNFKLWSKNDDEYLEAFSTKFLYCEKFYNENLIISKILK